MKPTTHQLPIQAYCAPGSRFRDTGMRVVHDGQLSGENEG